MTGGAGEMQACEVMSESCCGGCHALPCPGPQSVTDRTAYSTVQSQHVLAQGYRLHPPFLQDPRGSFRTV